MTATPQLQMTTTTAADFNSLPMIDETVVPRPGDLITRQRVGNLLRDHRQTEGGTSMARKSTRKIAESRFAVSLVGLLFLVPGAVFAETLIVPATDNVGVMSSPLAAGVLYDLTSEGTYINCFNGCLSDAEWECGIGANDPPDQCDDPANWRETGVPSNEHDILIDNAEYDWMGTLNGIDFQLHQFSPALHTYRVQYLGQGVPIRLHIQDVQYVDNDGSLTVTIEFAATPVADGTWGQIKAVYRD